MNVLISACLLGVDCKYNGGNNQTKLCFEELKDVTFIPVCPEQLGGLSTPRLPSEIIDGDGNDVLDGKARVLNNKGEDVTRHFSKGAEETLRLAKLYNCEAAVLKQRSPSCGSSLIYDGSFKGKIKDGDGVTAALLKRNGIKVYSEENLEEFINEMNK
jgi:uncharacterized protein YbbK (DUF523 family)